VFQPGLEGLGERLLAGKRGKAGRSSETVWDAYMRKRKCAQLFSMLWPGQTRSACAVVLDRALKPSTPSAAALRTHLLLMVRQTLQREAGSCQGQGSGGSLGLGRQRP